MLSEREIVWMQILTLNHVETKWKSTKQEQQKKKKLKKQLSCAVKLCIYLSRIVIQLLSNADNNFI